MQVEINPRGNGACPLCELNGKCRIHDTIVSALAVFPGEEEMELVFYSCPQFQEESDE
jgi:hypothetical protein